MDVIVAVLALRLVSVPVSVPVVMTVLTRRIMVMSVSMTVLRLVLVPMIVPMRVAAVFFSFCDLCVELRLGEQRLVELSLPNGSLGGSSANARVRRHLCTGTSFSFTCS